MWRWALSGNCPKWNDDSKSVLTVSLPFNFTKLIDMREILYIQAGQLSNYVGAHFWNTQEAYLADDDNDYISHETSFREGTSKEVRMAWARDQRALTS